LLDALTEEEHGNKQYPEGTDLSGRGRFREFERAETEMKAHVEGLGNKWNDLSVATRNRATYEMYTRGWDADKAYEHAVMQEGIYGTKAGEERGPVGTVGRAGQVAAEFPNVGRPMETAGEPMAPAGERLPRWTGGEPGGLGGGANTIESWRNFLSQSWRDLAESRPDAAITERSAAADKLAEPDSANPDRITKGTQELIKQADETYALAKSIMAEGPLAQLDEGLAKLEEAQKDWLQVLQSGAACLIAGAEGGENG
jgi:hypothetical protein